MSKFISASIGVVLATAMCSASAGKPLYNEIEISGVFQEVIQASSNCPSGQSGHLSGYGNSAQLGRIVFLSSDCFNQTGPVFNFSNGKFMIATTSGEVLFADYSGQILLTGEGMKGVISSATFQITGGTGRYLKAKGGGTINGTEDLSNGQGTIQMNGRVLLK
jgi:hypothetical protein